MDRNAKRAPIVAIVVAHHPERTVLTRLLRAAREQVDRVLVVDNGSGPEVRSWCEAFGDPKVNFLFLDENLGVAAAQNRGIALARARGAGYVILFDQDSEPAPDLVARLLAVAEGKAASGVRVAAVGPRYVDERLDNPPPFIRVRGIRVVRAPCTSRNSAPEVDYLVASGSLVSMAALDAVGEMREELFVDYIDIEWGLRARSRGFRCFGACGASMRHDLGDTPIVVLGRRFPARSPLRHYYLVRNAVWMYRQAWLPLSWKIADGWRLVLKFGFYVVFARPRHRHCRMMSLGLWHGLLGRMGRLQ